MMRAPYATISVSQIANPVKAAAHNHPVERGRAVCGAWASMRYVLPGPPLAMRHSRRSGTPPHPGQSPRPESRESLSGARILSRHIQVRRHGPIEIVELEVPHEGSMCGLPCILCLLPCADCMLAEGPRLLLACFCGLGALFGGSCAGNQEGLAALGASDALAASAIRHLQNGAALQVGANQRDSHEQGLSAMGTDPGIPGLHEIGSLMN